MAKNTTTGPESFDVVRVPKAALYASWDRPFPELWDMATDGNPHGFSREARTTNHHCEAGFAVLRRGPDDKTFLLRQNW